MKILVISDKISNSLYGNFSSEKFGDIDCVISCGDLPGHYLDFVVSSLNIPCFYVPGNHDESFKKAPPPGWRSLDGEVVRFQSLNLMGLGGSMYYNGKSPFQYTEWSMRIRFWKLFPKLWWYRNRIDIFVSHAPAFEIGDLEDQAHRGFKTFRTILDKLKPRFFLHGHVHLSYGFISRKQTYKNTEVINGYEHFIIELDKE